MQAPDKIYLHRTTGNNRLNGKVHPYKPAKIRDDDKIIEYIRKDALLEWAKQKQYESLTIVADNFWQEVIDKLKSL